MNVLVAIVLGLAMGAVFGIALEKSRVFEPGAIVSQMQLRTFLMLKIFLTAVITGLIVLAVLQGVWDVKMYPKRLFGRPTLSAVCCSVSALDCRRMPGHRFCPDWCRLSRCMVHGRRRHSRGHGVWLSGAHVASLPAQRRSRKVTLDQLAYVPFWVMALSVAAVLVSVLVALERSQAWREEVGANLDGLAAAGSQTQRSNPSPKLLTAST